MAAAQDNPESFLKEGNDLFSKMNYQKAIDVYNKGLESFPDEPVLYYNRGNALQKSGEYGKAISDYHAAVKYNPRKILLKNIYFNMGNAHYFQAEKSKTDAADQIDMLKKALAEYELASDFYRKSLELERELAISNNTDFSKAGLYARKNWAFAREGWTDTWEQIKILERQNMKLEDGINNLLKSQTDLLPHLENYYLNSPKKDILDFNLKTLAQFHMDNREDITRLKELSEKEIERAHAELENYKTTVQNQQNQTANPGSPVQGADDEVKKLEEALNNANEIKNAIDQTVGLSEWIIDGLDTGKPLVAWKNSSVMIDILNNLNDYLKKQDAIKTNYLSVLKQLGDVRILISQLENIKNMPAGTEKYDSPELRIRKLSTEKLDSVVRHFLFINSQIDTIADKIAEHAESKAEDENQNKSKAGNELETQFKAFFQTLSRKTTLAALKHSKQMNVDIQEALKNMAEKILANGSPSEGDLSTRLGNTKKAFKFYENAGRSMIDIMVSLFSEAETIMNELDQTLKENHEKNIGQKYMTAFDLMDVFLFQYDVLVSDIEQKSASDMGLDRSALVGNLKSIQRAYENFEKNREINIQNRIQADVLLKYVDTIKSEILKGLRLIAPDVAASVFYEKLNHIIKASTDTLPTTPANVNDSLNGTKPLKYHLETLQSILDDYFQRMTTLFKKTDDTGQRDRLMKSIDHRKMAQTYIEKGISENIDMEKGFIDKRYITGDFLLKDLAATINKSYAVFSGQPDEAVTALKSAIQYQKSLKEQSLSAVDIETQEGGSARLSGYLSGNQKDIQMFSGIGAMKIREMLEKDDKPDDNHANALIPGQTNPQQCPNIDLGKLKESMGLIQDAMVEEEKIHTFLEAAEYHNTIQKHDDVIALLEKALALLENKDGQDKNKENKDDGEKENPNEQNKNNDQNQQNQGGQGDKKPAKPLELTPEQARELLNELNSKDEDKHEGDVKAGKSINVPRPW